MKNIYIFLGFQKPAVPTPEQFVKNYGGKRAINKILLANNGIAGKLLKNVLCTFLKFLFRKIFFTKCQKNFTAVKCIRSIRRWSYETFLNERAIKFVVMVTPEDLKGMLFL